MSQRDKAGGKAIRVRRRKTSTRPSAAVGNLKDQLDRRTRELNESREQQAATLEVLKAISSSPGDLARVFDAILERATRLCEATHGHVWRFDGEWLHVAAVRGDPQFVEWLHQHSTVRPAPGSAADRIVRGARFDHMADRREESAYRDNQTFRGLVDTGGIRASLCVAVRSDETLLGMINVYRQEIRPFTDKQIALVENFAAQAVIAIENTRLLNELGESLQQQTATADVLKVISRSTFDLQVVLDTLVESAARLCGAEMANIWRPKDGAYRLTASYGVTARYKEYLENKEFLNTVAIEPGRGTTVGRVLLERKTVHIHDIQADPDYKLSGLVALGGTRTMLGVPMLRQGDPIGVLVLVESAVRPFTDKQIELATTFADQAVIAIENVRLFEEVQARTRELSESLDQQTATSEVLKVISSSPGELEPVFNAMLENATHICDAKFGILFQCDGNTFDPVSLFGVPAALAEFLRKRGRFQPGAESVLDRVLKTKDVVSAEELSSSPPVKYGGARSSIGVPMLKEDELVGAFFIYRTELRPFTEKQVELLSNFADQAVIAIENTRLLNELRQRTDDLSESLQQQVATSEVLQVINASPGDLAPVFSAMLQRATRLCEAGFGVLWLFDGERFSAAAEHAIPDALAEFVREPVPVEASASLVKIVEGANIVHVSDLAATELYDTGNRVRRAYVQLGGARTLMSVALRKDNVLLGAFNVYRQEVRPFTDKQIELVKNFAAQAVIAIENARLLKELRQRTDDLSESLEQQTATSNVLEVISRSAFDLTPVFETVVESAVKVCGADKAFIFRFDGELLRMAASFNAPPEFREWVAQNPIRPGRHSGSARAALERRTIHIHDVQADPEYSYGAKNVENIRTILGVPILKGDELLGVIMIYRLEVSPFTDKQIALVETFADQAAIAIENVRLFEALQQRTNDLTESLQQQTATADVLKVISRSTFDLGIVLQTLVESVARLCDADKANITRQKDGVFFRAEAYGFSPEFMDYVRNIPIQPDRGSAFGRALLEGRAVHIPDVKADPEYTLVEGQKLGDYRTVLAVPMLREGVAIGVLSLTRSEVRPFSEKQIELASTFADQAAIAIENVRLFNSVEARTRELAKSLDDLRSAQDRLVQTEKLASLGQLTAGIAHEIKNPLNFVNNFSAVSVELIDELRQALASANLDSKLRAEVSEIADMLQGNLDKVVQHGKRADSIVKSMLLHSRQGSRERRPIDVNALVEESLNLAYHGARAEKQGFNITMQRSLDPAAGEVDVFPQEITRVLLNLISNGFYAATRRKAEGNGGNYEPTLAAATKNLGDRVEITIRDNGPGIPPEVKDKMFNPFFTTKPAGEGTGLGLSISHDIIVKQHGGTIEVETEPGEYTEFRITLPRAAAFVTASEKQA